MHCFEKMEAFEKESEIQMLEGRRVVYEHTAFTILVYPKLSEQHLWG